MAQGQKRAPDAKLVLTLLAQSLVMKLRKQNPRVAKRYLARVTELTERVQQAEAQSKAILQLLDTGNLKDFFDLKPVSGITLLAVCATIDERAAQKAKRLLSERNTRAINMRHDRPGGAREKINAIRKIWASGKYKSRDLCAQQECGALKMSFSAARKALRRTADPVRDR